MVSIIRQPNFFFVISALLLIPLGLGVKFYGGPFKYWVNDSLGGVIYVIFWCFFLALFFRDFGRIKRLPIWVFVFTSLLECLQLWNPPFLNFIRNTFMGAALLGNTFTWSDFIYYFAGCLISWYIIVLYERLILIRADNEF